MIGEMGQGRGGVKRYKLCYKINKSCGCNVWYGDYS